ncbi:MAG TPA: MFS transporter [Phycisphaerae bacterium]|nr:MFS transporter [Phycisphaerae bacterium]
MSENAKAIRILTLNTVAFTICFACWTMNGVLVTFLVENRVFRWDNAQVGWLLGIPVLTGSVSRLPIGVLTDRYGGRIVYGLLMLLSAIPMYLLSYADSYGGFLAASLGFGFSGAAFAVGIAYTSVWFAKEHQGTALGIFGIGNAGSALTSMAAPLLLRVLTQQGENLEAWRHLPRIYAAALVIMAVVFFLLTEERRTQHNRGLSMRQRLAPLAHMRVWRFGLYYFLVFGGFVALAQWLIPYYVNAYSMTVATAGLMAAIFSLPSGVVRALGGWMSDRWGARAVMYWVFAVCIVGCLLLCVPRMEIRSPGQGVMAARSGTVTAVSSESITVGDQIYPLKARQPGAEVNAEPGILVFPTFASWQEPVVRVGDEVVRKQLLARGVTHIFFQANVWIFTFLVFVVGIAMGIGKAAVYKFIPDYFPHDVGVVGGMVGVLGGLGGFFCPIVFGYLLRGTGLWTTCWMFLLVVSVGCLVWMHAVVRRMFREQMPTLFQQIDEHGRLQPAGEPVRSDPVEHLAPTTQGGLHG